MALMIRQRVAFPVHGLPERRRGFSHSVHHRPAAHRQTALLHGNGPRTVLRQRIRQSLAHLSPPHRLIN